MRNFNAPSSKARRLSLLITLLLAGPGLAQEALPVDVGTLMSGSGNCTLYPRAEPRV